MLHPPSPPPPPPESPSSSYGTPLPSPARSGNEVTLSWPSPAPHHRLLSSTMGTAEYLRIHANASPSKLRNIIKKQVFVHDDVEYLKRLVKDVGGFDYVFRFLWYDGPVPAEEADGSRLGDLKQTSDDGPDCQSNRSTQYGRTWIQYCCYHNAHQCLQWVFQEIVRNHLFKEQQYRKKQTPERTTEMSSITMSGSDRQTIDSSAKGDQEGFGEVEKDDAPNGDQMKQSKKIIKQLLEFPSPSYCGTHYVAVATLRNSYQCLYLLIEYGGLNPSTAINAHGSTAAHLAAFKDHLECLRVLQSGTYACHFDDSDESNEELSLHSTTSGESDAGGGDQEFPHREAFCSLLTASPGNETMWSCDWSKANAQGETAIHVAAREGCERSMNFFLDMAITSAANALTEEDAEEDICTADFSIRNNDGMDCASVAAKHNKGAIISLLSESIERLLDLSIDVPEELPPPSPARQFLNNALSYFQADHATPQPPAPQSPLSANRRRTKSEPVNMYSKAQKPTQPPSSQKKCLPHYFPSLNLRNSLEKHNHETPLHVAARCGNCNAIEALFQSQNCDTTARDSLGQTALHVAALEGHLDACQLIIHLAGDQFESFDVVDILGRTPLYIACSMGNPSLARLLVPVSNWRVICHERKQSTDGPLFVDVAHQPPLHAAIVNDHVNTVSELLDCGVDVNQTDVDGRAAISVAAKLGYYEMCQKLILYGANVNTRSKRGGPTPYQKAKKYKHQSVADLLYDYGGR